MKGRADIHNHILFGVDDGAKNINDTLDLIADEYEQGVRRIIFTPHFHGGIYEEKQEIIRRNYEEVKKVTNEKYSDLDLYLGNEIFYTEYIIELLNKGRINTLAGSKYVLVEFMPGIRYKVMEQNIREILLNGYIPIIAHCERYECLYNNFGKILHFVENGVYLQVNADSMNTFRTRKFIKKLIEYDCLHFVASDAHNRERRGVHFDKCISYLSKKYGEEYVNWLLVENPEKVINNQYI